ncbi:helix-turn-helix domain-containing protein [Streptomyces sp. NPDC088789]|uniref:helix-turn-helix domain-containing protein n=1 Tax=Streptomyces sp. NPDC088789 TaxID=3365899 RepID=UPI0038161418
MPASPSSSAQAARQALAARLRDLRLDAELTVRELAHRAGWSHSKVSRIENARTGPAPEDVRIWARECHADGRAEELVAALRAVDGMWIEWSRMERRGLQKAQESVRPLYDRTRAHRVYDSWLVPGLLQTMGYTTVILHATRRRRGLIDDVEAAVAERMDRQHVLYDSRHTFVFLLEEAVLRAGIGGREVMREQLRHLLTVGFLPNVSLGIVPMQPDRSAMRPVEDFWIFDNAQVAVELVSGYLTITQPSEIKMYVQAFQELGALAVFGDSARSLIHRAITVLG